MGFLQGGSKSSDYKAHMLTGGLGLGFCGLYGLTVAI